MKTNLLFSFLPFLPVINSHSADSPTSDARLEELNRKWGTDWSFTGISTFAHLPHVRCLTDPGVKYDIAIVGAPFDTAVSYRPGARFGPRAIRAASARQTPFRGYNPRAGINPYGNWATILDCGDIPITPFDNALALRQMAEGFYELGTHSTMHPSLPKPKLVTLGGDHSIVLGALRALKKIHSQEITVVHFDAHLDTWHPAKYPSAWIDENDHSTQSFFTHGTMFWQAADEGLLANGSNIHAGLRTRLASEEDNTDDGAQGWARISADDIDDIGVQGVVRKILSHVGVERPVYLSIDIDVIDPGLAPGTGTPEPGGWTTRELIRILRGIEGLNVVGADVVEVSPYHDASTETTALAAAQVVYEIVTSIVKREAKTLGREGNIEKGDPGKVKDEL